MQDKCCVYQENCDGNFKDAVCIHTDKVIDSCRDKDCLENVRVYLTKCGQEIIDRAISVKCSKAEVIWVMSDVEEVPFNRGFYSIDIKYFFKITLQVFTGSCHPEIVEGLATFTKRVILFGSEGNAKIFSSKYREKGFDEQMWKKTNMPYAVVEVVEPIALGAKVMDVRREKNCCCYDECDVSSVPECVCKIFEEELVSGGECKRAYVSLGVFSIVKLERRVQVLVPCYDYCIPDKECVGATSDDNPCELFDRIDFPIDEFYPPEKCSFLNPGDYDPSVKCLCD